MDLKTRARVVETTSRNVFGCWVRVKTTDWEYTERQEGA